MKKTWKELFPDALLGESTQNAVPVQLNGETIFLLEESLSERERFLIQTLTTQPTTPTIPTHPWLAYLEGKGALPSETAYIQSVHLAVFPKQEGVFHEKDWLEFVENLTVGAFAIFKNFRHHYTLVVNPEVSTALASTLFEVKSAIEDDFAVELQIFIGNRWATNTNTPLLYQAEKALFVEYLLHSHKRSCLEFSPVLLWGIANGLLDIAPIADELLLLLNVEEVKEFVEALWDAHGNVSKASKKLFLHRNTLQYRIDRFAEQTGLNVKDMSDLTLCHLLLQKQSY
mgnify:FL=1